MRTSAGLLIFRIRNGRLEVFLIHPGGPLWAMKEEGAWSIPKGEFTAPEEPLNAARREFHEETGYEAFAPFTRLTPVHQSSHKMVQAWAAEGDFDPSGIRSNTFNMEWPPRSGRMQDFPEADRAAWFPIDVAREKILKGQIPLLDELENILTARPH